MKAILKRTLGKGSIPSLWNVMLNYAMGCRYDRHTTSSTDITYKANHRTNFDSQLKTPSPIPNCTSFKMGSDVMLTRCASQQTRLSPWRTPTIHYGGINGSEKIYGKWEKTPKLMEDIWRDDKVLLKDVQPLLLRLHDLAFCTPAIGTLEQIIKYNGNICAPRRKNEAGGETQVDQQKAAGTERRGSATFAQRKRTGLNDIELSFPTRNYNELLTSSTLLKIWWHTTTIYE